MSVCECECEFVFGLSVLSVLPIRGVRIESFASPLLTLALALTLIPTLTHTHTHPHTQ
jgi:hypothetical protein